jgi:hypothetical protein
MDTMIAPDLVEKLKTEPDGWAFVELAQDLADVANEGAREARRRRKYLPMRDKIQATRERWAEWLWVEADNLGDLGDGVPVTDEERLWHARLTRYEVLSEAIAVATDVYQGLYRIRERGAQ